MRSEEGGFQEKNRGAIIRPLQRSCAKLCDVGRVIQETEKYERFQNQDPNRS